MLLKTAIDPWLSLTLSTAIKATIIVNGTNSNPIKAVHPLSTASGVLLKLTVLKIVPADI